ncbi:hypothetical protein AC579_4922 [Pseudocercospora musae]|uniref:Uncharacterized protein n=1 Tax=Pseudocercospora musae TaxID=113226 RepID=A0A139IEL0_9PEZI|nr:hypothetical protein AC579_4922 [Pseudocercospora musae]
MTTFGSIPSPVFYYHSLDDMDRNNQTKYSYQAQHAHMPECVPASPNQHPSLATTFVPRIVVIRNQIRAANPGISEEQLNAVALIQLQSHVQRANTT